MKTIGLNTCIVIRLLTGEPSDQATKAELFLDECFQENTQLFVSDMVVAETYYALIYHYKVPKPECIKTLLEFLSSPFVKTTGHAVSILSEYNGKGVGFVDQLIRRDYLSNVDNVATFDKEFAKMANVILV